MENDEQGRKEFQKRVLRMQADCDRANDNMQRFFDKGDPNDLESVVSYMHDYFLKPTIARLGRENSKAGLERMLEQLQTQSAKFQEKASKVDDPNQKKFVERWNNEVAAAISKVKEQLSKFP